MDDLAEKEAQLQRDATELARLQKEFAAERARWEQEREAQEKQRPQSQKTRSSATAVNDELTGSTADRFAADSEESEEGVAAESTAANEDDIFARLRALSLLKDDAKNQADEEPTGEALEEVAEEADEESPQLADEEPSAQTEEEAVEEAAPAEVAQENAVASDRAHADEQESIDDYMSQLLARVRGTSGKPGTAAVSPYQSAPRKEPQESVKPTQQLPENSTEQAKAEAEAPPILVKFEPRTAAPEKIRDLSAMRELANFSARSAIASHHQRRNAIIVWGKLGVAVLGLICGALLLFWQTDGQAWIMLGGVAGLVVSGYWFVHAGLLAKSMQKLRRKSEKASADRAEEHANAEAKRASDNTPAV
jgi:hypothetical protein